MFPTISYLNTCCEEDIPTQVCSWLTMPYGFDVTIPAISGCYEAGPDESPFYSPDCVCDNFPGTHKAFRYDYVNRATKSALCDSAQTSLNCQWVSVSDDTVQGKRGPNIVNCSVSGDTTIYEPKWYEYHWGRTCVSGVCSYCPEPFCEEHSGNDVVNAEPRFIWIRTGGLSPGPSGIAVTITLYRRVYINSTCAATETTNTGWSATYAGYFPSGTNVAEYGTFTLNKTTGSANSPATIALAANSMDLPSSGA